MNEYITKRQLYEFIDTLRKDLKLTFADYPLDLISILSKRSDFELVFNKFKCDKLWGMAFKGDISNMIVINDNKSYKEKQFIAGHELIHIKKHPVNDLGYKCFEKPQSIQNSYLEWQANEGSAELFVPYKILLPLVEKKYDELLQGLGTFSYCDELSNYFEVSSNVIQCRLNSLKYEIYQYHNGISLESLNVLSITQQEKHGIFIKSLNELEDERLINWINTRKQSQSITA